ncbi:MAG: flavocytochrome c [Bacteroidales bacterium]|nr:flavocytochrome c [Bacteroidales bacterium]MBQ8421273.1 flavocytochrome c [Bacteroidales bacterium]
MKRLIHILALVGGIAFLAGCDEKEADLPQPEQAVMQDGVYEGLGEGRSGMIKVAVEVKEHIITAIRILSQSESKFAQPAEQQIIEAVLEKQTTEGVDAVSGATLTSNGMLAAIGMAIDASKGVEREEAAYTDTSCDIVVVGAGGAGLAAAVQASSMGAHVIVLEKQGIIGGNTNYSTGGLNAAETSVQKKLGITDSRQSHFDDTMSGGHYLNDPSLVTTLVNKAAAVVDWLISLGADMGDVGKMAGSSQSRTHRPSGGAAIGPHLMSVLSRAVQAENISIRTRNTVTALTEKDGKVTGVKVNTSKGTYSIQAKAVIIATGGFGANLSMVEQYRPELKGFGTSNHHGATGDAFEWVEALQVPLVHMDQIQVHPTGETGSHLLITEAVRGNGAILVNSEGVRFADEMWTRDRLSDAILEQTGKSAYIIFDQSVRESLSAIENYAQQGLLTSAGTVSELAQALNLPVPAFVATMEAYRMYQVAGEDPDFGRKAEEMPRPLNQAPYYAIHVEPVIHHTMGGIKINSNAEVLNEAGEAVPGLYAAGEVTGGVHGGNRLGGNAVADIMVFGQIAGTSAARFASANF